MKILQIISIISFPQSSLCKTQNEVLEDIELLNLIESTKSEPTIQITITELRNRITKSI